MWFFACAGVWHLAGGMAHARHARGAARDKLPKLPRIRVWRTRGTRGGRLHAVVLCTAAAVGAMLWLDKSLAQSDWLVWVALWGWAAAMISAWCFLPAPLVALAAEEGRDETA